MSLNKYRNVHWTYINEEKQRCALLLRWKMQEQKVEIRPLKIPIHTKFHFYSFRKRDIDGECISIKNFHDSLIELGMIPDDKVDFVTSFEVHSRQEKGNFFDVEIIEEYNVEGTNPVGKKDLDSG